MYFLKYQGNVYKLSLNVSERNESGRKGMLKHVLLPLNYTNFTNIVKIKKNI